MNISIKRSVSILLTLLIIYFVGSNDAFAQIQKISNPRIGTDSTLSAGQAVVWDTITYGSYPQTEVKKTDAVYNELKSAAAESWDENGDITLDNGDKYRRMKKGDATYTNSNSSWYSWSDSTTYHYFKYEPIKWRVLKTDGKTALVLSESSLNIIHMIFKKVGM